VNNLRSIALSKDSDGSDCLVIDDIIITNEMLEKLDFMLLTEDDIEEMYNTNSGELYCDLVGDSFNNISDKKIISENLKKLLEYEKIAKNARLCDAYFFIFDISGKTEYSGNVSINNEYNLISLQHKAEIAYNHFTKK
jgi:hypothetical protein